MAPDTVAPTPDPATFAVAPTADSSTSLSMTATPGSDASGPVEYQFSETSGNPGGTSSGWQTSPTYTNTGLQPSTQYTYTVTMRDSLDNTGTASNPASATTQAPQPFDTFTNQSALAWDEIGGLYQSISYKVEVATSPQTPPQITSITPVGGGVWELTFAGQPNTGYEFRASSTLAFNPGTLVENLTQGNPGVDAGTIGGTNNSTFTTNGSGNATVRVMLTGFPADFVRAQSAP